jgi:hypothetical protein
MKLAKPMFVDIETVPFKALENWDEFEKMKEEDKLKLLNPIESCIVAIGVKIGCETFIIKECSEQDILRKFWNLRREYSDSIIVGFNIQTFDMPMLVARSFINGNVIVPFLVKEIIDLRDKMNACAYGHHKGKMKEYAKAIGLKILDTDGSDVARLVHAKQFVTIEEYLLRDIEITEAIYIRQARTKIIEIDRW